VADTAEKANGSLMPGPDKQPVRSRGAEACESNAVLHPRVPLADVYYVSCGCFSAREDRRQERHGYRRGIYRCGDRGQSVWNFTTGRLDWVCGVHGMRVLFFGEYGVVAGADANRVTRKPGVLLRSRDGHRWRGGDAVSCRSAELDGGWGTGGDGSVLLGGRDLLLCGRQAHVGLNGVAVSLHTIDHWSVGDFSGLAGTADDLDVDGGNADCCGGLVHCGAREASEVERRSGRSRAPRADLGRLHLEPRGPISARERPIPK